MLLRSSSTPLLGSLLPEATPTPFQFHCNTLSFASLNPTAPLHSSPSSINAPDFSDRHRRGFQRAHSEGNLNTLAHVSDDFDSFNPNNFTDRPTHSMLLETIPSFSFYHSTARTDDPEDDGEREGEGEGEGGYLGVDNKTKAMAMEEAWSRVSFGEGREFMDEEMHLARGLGIGGAGGGGSGGGAGGFNGEGGGDKLGMEEYYKKMVVENPENALVLRNYAEFLYQWKGDLGGAEEYYSRAILMDSEDGEILSQYAKVVWELHHDQQTASSCFQRAVQASPHDCHVQAAYANFLWETKEDDDERRLAKEMVPQTFAAAATA